MKKAKNLLVTNEFLEDRAKKSIRAGYSKQKWVSFCEILLRNGFELYLYEARETVSKYITIKKDSKEFIVRFSNHRPNKKRELKGDCDFFVGVTHTGIRTTDDALKAVRRFYYGY